MFDQTRVSSVEEHLLAELPDVAVMYFHPDKLNAEAQRFVRGFGGLVTYAVKANPEPEVLKVLLAAGVAGFDVASPDEIARVRAQNGQAALHYNNPVRSQAEVTAGKAAGVASWSVDEMGELAKLGTARAGEEASVRFKLPVSGAHYDFGEKFGATPERAAELLQAAVARGYAPSLCFHPGTQCADPSAWEAYIKAASAIAKAAGVTLARLNVGGGFAAHRGGAAPDLERIFEVINSAVGEAFDTPPALVCEPGRAMVAESYTLATRVKALREDGSLFLNDGIYGALAEWRDMAASTRVQFVSAAGQALGGKTQLRRAFGPTCDSLDVLPEPLACPEALSAGDYVLFAGMGAYSLAIATGFNGYGPRRVVKL